MPIICASNVAGTEAFINHMLPNVHILIDHTKEKAYVHNVIGPTITTIKDILIIPIMENQ